jgi:uncharacterized protein YbbC (DUF1343 family)
VVDRRAFAAVRTGFELLAAIRALWPNAFSWRTPGRGIYNFDRLAGTDRIRLALDQGASPTALVDAWEEERGEFAAQRARHLIYPN